MMILLKLRSMRTILTKILLSHCFLVVSQVGLQNETHFICPVACSFRFVLAGSLLWLFFWMSVCLLACRFVPIDDGDESCVDGEMWPSTSIFFSVGIVVGATLPYRTYKGC